MPIPFFDLTRQYKPLAERMAQTVEAVFSSQQFILGKRVEDFERQFCETFGCAHAVGMSSGTDAQLAILMALGIGRGDAVITTPYTFFATAGCIARCGAEPVFLDVRRDTLTLDPEQVARYLDAVAARGMKTALGNKIKAIIPVHLFGTCADMHSLRSIARHYQLAIVEDACQAVGTTYGDAHESVGSMGDAAFFSFFPTKNLGGAGDAGMAVCRDAEFAARLRRIRNHGMEKTYHHIEIGGNFRLDALQAAVLSMKMLYLKDWNRRRRLHATQYRAELTDVSEIILPLDPDPSRTSGTTHTYHQFVIRSEQRDELQAALTAASIGTAIYYPLPLHLQPCFQSLGYSTGSCPEAELASRTSLALPIFPELEDSEIATICRTIKAFYKR